MSLFHFNLHVSELLHDFANCPALLRRKPEDGGRRNDWNNSTAVAGPNLELYEELWTSFGKHAKMAILQTKVKGTMVWIRHELFSLSMMGLI